MCPIHRAKLELEPFGTAGEPVKARHNPGQRLVLFVFSYYRAVYYFLCFICLILTSISDAYKGAISFKSPIKRHPLSIKDLPLMETVVNKMHDLCCSGLCKDYRQALYTSTHWLCVILTH
jgi:hypothetical protein